MWNIIALFDFCVFLSIWMWFCLCELKSNWFCIHSASYASPASLIYQHSTNKKVDHGGGLPIIIIMIIMIIIIMVISTKTIIMIIIILGTIPVSMPLYTSWVLIWYLHTSCWNIESLSNNCDKRLLIYLS